jgi:hypothetical protein
MAIGKEMQWTGDATTLNERMLLPGWTAGEAAFLSEGARLLTLTHKNGEKPELRLYDVAHATVQRRWELPHDSWMLAVSPDERHAMAPFNERSKAPPGLVFDLAGASAAPPRALPLDEMHSVQPAFFPDGRRMMAANVWHSCPGVIDLVTGRHVGSIDALPSWPPYWNIRQMIASRDGRFVAIIQPWRQMIVCEHVGDESAWGVMASPWFYLLAACIGLLVASLCRDALRSSRRWNHTARLPRRRKLLAGALAIAGACGLVSPLFWAMWARDYLRIVGIDHLLDNQWLSILLLLHLFAGLGLMTRSRAWTVLLILLLLLDVACGLTLAYAAYEQFATTPRCILDRMWLLSPALMRAVNLAWAALSMGGLLALLPIGRGRVHS